MLSLHLQFSVVQRTCTAPRKTRSQWHCNFARAAEAILYSEVPWSYSANQRREISACASVTVSHVLIIIREHQQCNAFPRQSLPRTASVIVLGPQAYRVILRVCSHFPAVANTQSCATTSYLQDLICKCSSALAAVMRFVSAHGGQQVILQQGIV